MDLIAQDIFSHLDLISLMNCELVCKNWYSAIKKGKLWKRLYCQECHKSSLLPTLFQRRGAINQWEWEADRLVKSEETLLKNLFKTQQILKENWAVGNFQTTTTTLTELNVSHLKWMQTALFLVLLKNLVHLLSISGIAGHWNVKESLFLLIPLL